MRTDGRTDRAALTEGMYGWEQRTDERRTALNVCLSVRPYEKSKSDKRARRRDSENLALQFYLTLRRLMSYIYIYGAPILDVSRSHTTTQHSR